MGDEEVGASPEEPDDWGLAPIDEPTVSAPPVVDLPPGEDHIPPAPLAAMRTRMHSNRRLEPGDEGRIRRRLGDDDDDAVYVIDDGPDHCMVGRRVGGAPDGCVYCLVARVSLEGYADIVAGAVDRDDVYSDARDISLCGVFEDGDAASNVFLVQHYRRPRDVPADYLPPTPFLEFTDDVEGDVDGDGDGDGNGNGDADGDGIGGG
jgi:hypothetical protein